MKLPRLVRECYAAHVVLHVGCKVPLGDIFVVPALTPDGRKAVGVQAKVGNFEFVVTIGRYKDSFKEQWLKALPLINAASEEEREKAVNSTWAREHAVEIIFAFLEKKQRYDKAN